MSTLQSPENTLQMQIIILWVKIFSFHKLLSWKCTLIIEKPILYPQNLKFEAQTSNKYLYTS